MKKTNLDLTNMNREIKRIMRQESRRRWSSNLPYVWQIINDRIYQSTFRSDTLCRQAWNVGQQANLHWDRFLILSLIAFCCVVKLILLVFHKDVFYSRFFSYPPLVEGSSRQLFEYVN